MSEPTSLTPSTEPDRTNGNDGRRRGRPVGSVSLTDEIQRTIVEALRAGVMPGAASNLAGIAPRTYFEWIERGEGRHPTRSATPKLKAFAKQARVAIAQARAYAEARVYREHPKYWLTHAARSKPGLEGWTHPKEERVEDRSWLDRMLAEERER
jgi:hypothetical protein